jgi:hypothetical protein
MSNNNSDQLNHISNVDNSTTSLSTNSVEDVISILKTTIDRNFNDARNLILELARRLDETKNIKRSRVCLKIKELLRDKITEGKITKRWIESLPSDYKRRYIKSEVSFLSENGKKENIEVTSMDQIMENDRSNNCCTQRYEINETLQKTSLMTSKLNLAKNEIYFKIPKEKYQEIKIVMNNSRNCFYLIFDMITGLLLRSAYDEADK